MKIRSSFVTNSSSSSFIVSAKDADFKDLYCAFKELYYDKYEEYPKLSDVINSGDSGCALFIKNGKEVNDDSYGETSLPEDELYYVIDNNDCGRFDWETVREIFEGKYRIPYIHGFCD